MEDVRFIALQGYTGRVGEVGGVFSAEGSGSVSHVQ